MHAVNRLTMNCVNFGESLFWQDRKLCTGTIDFSDLNSYLNNSQRPLRQVAKATVCKTVTPGSNPGGASLPARRASEEHLIFAGRPSLARRAGSLRRRSSGVRAVAS